MTQTAEAEVKKLVNSPGLSPDRDMAGRASRMVPARIMSAKDRAAVRAGFSPALARQDLICFISEQETCRRHEDLGQMNELVIHQIDLVPVGLQIVHHAVDGGIDDEGDHES